MSFFDESLQGMDPQILRSSIEQMKGVVQQEVEDEFYSKEEGDFILAAIENLTEELKGLTNFDSVALKQKARIVAFMSFIYDVLEQDEDFDDGDFDDDEDEDEDEDFDGEEDKAQASKKGGKKIESFPE